MGVKNQDFKEKQDMTDLGGQIGHGGEFSKGWGDDDKAQEDDKVMSTVDGGATSHFRTQTNLTGKVAQSQV